MLESSNFIYTMRTTNCTCNTENKTKVPKLYFVFPFFFLSLQYKRILEFSSKIISFTEATKHRILKFDTNIWYDKLCCVLKNQPTGHTSCYGHSRYLSIFLSLSLKTSATVFSAPVIARIFIVCIHLKGGQVCWV